MKPPVREPQSESLLVRWSSLWGTLWLIGFGLFFYSFTLPNNSHITRLDIWLALPELIAGNLLPEQSEEQGWRFLLERIPVAFVSGCIVLAAIAAGRLVLRGLRICGEMDFSTRFALSGGLGLSLISLTTLGCGLAGGLSRTLFLTIGLALLAAEAAMTARDLRQTPKGKPSTAESSSQRLMWAALLVLLPFVSVMLLGALLPSIDFDVKEYHLEGPKEYFLNGQITMLPHNVYTSFPFLTEMLTLTGMVLWGDWYWGAVVGKGVLFAFAPITAVGTYALAKRIAGPTAGWTAAVLYLTTPWVYRISIIAYTEGALCAYVLLTLLAFDCAVRSAPATKIRWWLLVGMLAGSATATKYPGLVFVAFPVGCALLFSEWSKRIATSNDRGLTPPGSPGRALVTAAVIYILGILVTFGPWMAKNAAETGNPVYPLLWSVFGGADWNAELQAKWKDAHGAPTHLFTQPVALIRDLVEKVIDVAAKSDWQGALIFGLLPVALFVQSERRRIRWLALFALLFFLLWFGITHRIDRFWVPMLPVLCVLAGVGGATLWKRWLITLNDTACPQLLALGGVSVTVIWIAATLVYQWAFITLPVCGLNSYLTRYDAVRTQVLMSAPLIEYLELSQPVDAPQRKILFVGEAQVFDSTDEYLYNTVFDLSLFEEWTAEPADASLPSGEKRMRASADIGEKFHEEKITHIAVNWSEILRYRTTYRYTDYVTPERFETLVAAGVLEQERLPAEAYSDLSQLPESWQQEVRSWGPSLIRSEYGVETVPRFSVYRVK